MSLYPNALDSDLEIPKIEDNITEVSSDTINALRDAVFAVEKTLGISIQGNKTDFSERINVSIDNNGRIKPSSLDGIGLVSLPIGNSHVGDNAAIEETKLDLDYSTQTLRNLISSNQTNIGTISSDLLSLSNRFNGHILGTGNYHDGYHIKINRNTFIGVAGLSSTNVGDAINEISTFLLAGDSARIPHIDLDLPSSTKHLAESIGAAQSSTYSVLDMTSYDLQSVIENIDFNLKRQQEKHVDGFHSNGIFRDINAGDYYNSNQSRLSTTGLSYTKGSSVVTVPSISDGGAPSFSDYRIYSGSILVISGVADAGTYQIIETGPLTASDTLGDIPTLSSNQIYVSHIFSETKTSSDSVSFVIYDAASVSSETAPLACAVKNNESLVDSITILNPNAARVVSLGFNGDILGIDGYELIIEAGVGNNQSRTITIPDLNKKRLGEHAGIVDAQSVAERINAYVSDPTLAYHFPITAFKLGNELAISHNLVGSEYTLKILSGNGNYALGLDEYGADVVDRTIYGNSNNTYSVNGKSLNTLKTIFSGTSSLSAPSANISLYDSNGALADPIQLGIQAGDVLHITEHSTDDTNGSYTISTVSSTYVSVFAAESVAIDSNFNVLVSSSFISLDDLQSAESNSGLVSIYVDEDGYTFYKQRAQYTSLGNAEVIDLSSSFPVGDVTVLITASGDNRVFNIVYDSVSGASKTIHKDFNGIFKLYHTNNVDYALIKVTDKNLSATSQTLSVYRVLNEDEAMELCLAHFDGATGITNIIDKRLFGNLGINQIRDDFIEVYCQRPFSELRSNGIVRGFELRSIDYSDGYTGMHALPLTGGVAYVNGSRCEVSTQNVVLQSYNDGFEELDGYRIIGINEQGTIRSYSDELGEILSDGYSSSIEYGEILPLYRITLKDGLPHSVIDLRLFINNLDDKIELIVDETNNRVGNFKTIEGALLYAESYPNNEKLTIRIINTVNAVDVLRIPEGVSIIGSAIFGGGRHKILNDSNLDDDFIILKGGNRLENIEIASSTIQMDGALVLIDGANINIEGCLLRFTDGDSISSNSSDVGIKIAENALDNIRIINNRIDNVYSGIVAPHGFDNITIAENEISNVYGSATSAYGILLGSWARSITSASIYHNMISVPDIGASDVRCINIDVDNTISTIRIENNNILHTSDTTVTNGIRIENTASSGNKITDLIVAHNKIYGIMSDDNDIWGIWISNTEVANVYNNIIRQVGRGGNTDNGFIGCGSNVDYIKCESNIVQDGNANYGIYKATTNSSTEECVLSNNTISDIGSTAYYVYGTTSYSNIDNNLLVGTGARGIQWSGAYSKINNNNLTGSTSFSDYGIYTTASDLDICNNTISNLGSGAVGIITNTSRNRIKMTGNTVSGIAPVSLITIYGSHHIVSKNKLTNISGTGTAFITLNGTTDCLIDGNLINVLAGSTTNGILEANGTTTTRVTISNNTMIGTITNGLNMSNADDCFIFGNKVPDSITNTIGSTPATATINTNLIGTNRGMLDTMGVSMAEGVSGRAGGDEGWEIDSSDASWSPSAVGTYYLFFPLNKLPNGARIVSVDVSGKNPADPGGVLSLDIYRKSMKSTFAIDAISTGAVSIAAGTAIFGPGQTTTGQITADTTGDVNIINYEESNYYLRVATDGSTAITAQIDGITINFRY